jgi:hypothetical protein
MGVKSDLHDAPYYADYDHNGLCSIMEVFNYAYRFDKNSAYHTYINPGGYSSDPTDPNFCDAGHPQLDDDGNGVGHPTYSDAPGVGEFALPRGGDGALARRIYL